MPRLHPTARLLFTLLSFYVATCTAQSNASDWRSNWQGSVRTLDSALQMDPLDNRTTMRGVGLIALGNGIANFTGEAPRLYVSHPGLGWENVQLQAYANFVSDGSELKSYSGFTLAARSNHDMFKRDGCDAFGYYARLYRITGECTFLKEYYHASDGSGTIYALTVRVPCIPGGIPLSQWIGLRFRVVTLDHDDAVRLELWLDRKNDGRWTLDFAFEDRPGRWLPQSEVPASCPQRDGGTVLWPRKVSFLRTDGSRTTEVHWRDALFENIQVENVQVVENVTSNATSSAPAHIPSITGSVACLWMVSLAMFGLATHSIS